MIGVSRLYCDQIEASEPLRYGHAARTAPAPRPPVVVWNATNACNLACVHCYASSGHAAPRELTTAEAVRMIADLATLGCPVLLLSGGEPLARPDVFDLAALASRRMRVVLSTNGTLITREVARRLADVGVAYVGISIDGMGELHDELRGRGGAFDAALAGLRHCVAVGLKVGLRFTLTRRNVHHVDDVFDLLVRERANRVCFYHLVYAGRGSGIAEEDLHVEQARWAMDRIIDGAAALHRDQRDDKPGREVLTVDHPADGPYLYLRMRREGHPRADEVLSLLRTSSAARAELGIACVGPEGDVHPNQFWRHERLGNVREEPFSRIWTDTSHELLAQLRSRHGRITGRCATCRFLDTCGGGSRVRARAATGDLWASDPACYLTDDEIAGPIESLREAAP